MNTIIVARTKTSAIHIPVPLQCYYKRAHVPHCSGHIAHLSNDAQLPSRLISDYYRFLDYMGDFYANIDIFPQNVNN